MPVQCFKKRTDTQLIKHYGDKCRQDVGLLSAKSLRCRLYSTVHSYFTVNVLKKSDWK